MLVQLYNTLSHQTEVFTPLKKGKVGLYTCGPTVYHFAHIGNLRTYVFEDILKRVLMYNGYKVKHVMNITDVGHLTSDNDTGEDKMEKGAKREGKTAWDIAKFYTAAFLGDLHDLNILPPDQLPRATDHIKEQIAIIKKLEKKGFTYRTADGVYFDTAKLPDYGKLANLRGQKLAAGARVSMGDKKNPHDFALWKLSLANEQRQMEWDSPWGVGFPGWHIECSAMATKYLGQPFDIHCGGIDHVPVHHTNEIAQSEAAAGKPLANYWLHGEFLLIGTDKMAKSGDNFLTLASLAEHEASPLAYRFFLLQTHYRKQLNFSWEALAAAQTGLNNLYSLAVKLKKYPNKIVEEKHDNRIQFIESINDDLNIPIALATTWSALKTGHISYKKLLEFDQILGLQIKENVERLEKIVPESISPEIKNIITERDTARSQKDWAKSDELRKSLEAAGYEVTDSPEGTEIAKK